MSGLPRASYAAEPSGASRVGLASVEGPGTDPFGQLERDTMAETAAKTTKPRKAAAKPAGAGASAPKNGGSTATRSTRDQAKSRFNAALEEARAGAALLGAEAKERVGVYSEQARTRGGDWAGEARTKAGELAVQGKSKASEALSGLSRMVTENAPTIDENLGPKYGEYARSASRKLEETAQRLDQKSVEELTEDAREMVRKSPAAAVGLAALAGFLLARILRR
jgi:ElaB/YqjD/DUF883 family membrane-anchored ribosome-binding protein